MSATSNPNSIVRPPSALRRALWLCTADGLVATPLVTMSLPVNVFLAALLTKGLHLPKETIGFIAALPFACNFLQIFVSPLLGRWFRPKGITTTFALLHASSWAILAVLLSFLPTDDPAAAGRWLAIWFFFSSFAASLCGVAWNAWVQDWVPARLRGKYFSRRNRLLSFSTVAFLASTGWALEAGQYALWTFQAVIGVNTVLRFLSIRWIWQTPRTPTEAHAVPTGGFQTQLQIVRDEPSFLRFVLFGSVWAFAANLFGTFYYVFMFEIMQLSSLTVSFYTILGAAGGALSLPAWGLLLDRYGNKPVMALSLLAWQLPNFIWCLVTPEKHQLLPYLWFWGGMMGAGFVLGQFTLLLKLVPPRAKNLAIGVNLAVTSLVAAIAPVLGGAILTWALARWADNSLHVYHACFAALPLLSLAAAALLLRVHEPKASRFTSVVGAMRSVRTISGIFGLTFFVNYVFYRPRKRG